MILREDDTVFSSVSACMIVDYLYTNDGKIQYKDLVTNKHCLTNTFDTTRIVFNLFNLYKDVITISTKGGQPISAQDKISSEYVLLKTSGAYDRIIEDWQYMTATQNLWSRFKTRLIIAYHKLKKHIKNQVNNIMTGEIPALISDKLQKVFTQLNEGHQKLAKISETNNTLKALV